jgi:MFS family permease
MASPHPSSVLSSAFLLSSRTSTYRFPEATRRISLVVSLHRIFSRSLGLTSVLAANGLFAGGGMIGCVIVAWLADKFGRVRTIQMICALSVIGAIIQGASVHIAMFLVGRTLGGMGAAMMNVIAPLYQSEISPPTMRGKMVGLHGFLIVCGYVSSAAAPDEED